MNLAMFRAQGAEPDLQTSALIVKTMLEPHAYYGLQVTGANGATWLAAVSLDKCQIVLACGPGFEQRIASRGR